MSFIGWATVVCRKDTKHYHEGGETSLFSWIGSLSFTAHSSSCEIIVVMEHGRTRRQTWTLFLLFVTKWWNFGHFKVCPVIQKVKKTTRERSHFKNNYFSASIIKRFNHRQTFEICTILQYVTVFLADYRFRTH